MDGILEGRELVLKKADWLSTFATFIDFYKLHFPCFDHLKNTAKEEELREKGRSQVQVLLSIFAEENFCRITETMEEQLI